MKKNSKKRVIEEIDIIIIKEVNRILKWVKEAWLWELYKCIE